MRKTPCILGIVLMITIGVSVIYRPRGPREPTYQGLTIHQWLKKLSSDNTTLEGALNVKRVFVGEDSRALCIEVPLSYDLLAKHGFIEDHGRLYLRVDGYGLSPHNERATNGNCLLEVDARGVPAGSHNVQVEFYISNPQDKRRTLHSKGAVSSFLMSSNIQLR